MGLWVRSVLLATIGIAVGGVQGCGGSQSRSSTQVPTLAQACPTQGLVNQSKVEIKLRGRVPERLSIQVDGKLAWSDCHEKLNVPPVVELRGNRAGLFLKFDLLYFEQPTLPTRHEIKIFERRECLDPFGELVFSSVSPVLEFKDVYPSGKKCGSYQRAELKLEDKSNGEE